MNQLDYYEKFKHNAIRSGWITRRIDRREPVFTYLVKEIKAQAKLLDIGCGVGRFLQPCEKYFRCTGIDISPIAINAAKKQLRRTNLFIGDVLKTDILEGMQFEVITIFDVLEHLQEPEKLILKAKNLLTKKGIIIISVPNTHALTKSCRGNKWWALEDKSHVSLLTPAEWEKIIELNGLKISQSFASGLINHPLKFYRLTYPFRVLQICTQSWALFGGYLPKQLNDLLIWELKL